MKNIFTIIALTAMTTGAFAGSSRVDFSALNTEGSFSCTAADEETALINIDTTHVDIKGGCPGSPYVQREGHLVGLPANILKHHYFEIRKKLAQAGHVEITSNKGEITCRDKKDGKPDSYGQGGYCGMPTE